MKWLLVAALVCAVGCTTVKDHLDRVEKAVRPMIERWVVEHPEEELSDAVKRELYAAAEALVERELDQENAEAAAKLAETAGALATGDYVGGGVGVLTLLLWWLGVRRK